MERKIYFAGAYFTLLIRFNIGIEILAEIRFAHVITSNKYYNKHVLFDLHFHFVYVSCSLQHASCFDPLLTPPIANTTGINFNLNPRWPLMMAFFFSTYLPVCIAFVALAEHNGSKSFLSFELDASIKGQTIPLLALKMSCFDLILGRVIVCLFFFICFCSV